MRVKKEINALVAHNTGLLKEGTSVCIEGYLEGTVTCGKHYWSGNDYFCIKRTDGVKGGCTFCGNWLVPCDTNTILSVHTPEECDVVRQFDYSDSVSRADYDRNYYSSIDPALTSISKPPMSTIIDKLNALSQTLEEKLLLKYGIESPLGKPTESGLAFLMQILYTDHREDIISALQAIEAAEEAGAKKECKK